MEEDIVIEKLVLEVDVKSQQEIDQSEWLTRLRSWLDADFFPKLEVSLKQIYPTNGDTVCLERLDVDLGWFSAKDFQTSAANRLHHLLTETHRQSATSTTGSGRISVVTRELDALAYFLKTGHLPWWKHPLPLSPTDWETHLATRVLNHKPDLGSLKSILREASARKRLANTFSSHFLKQLLLQIGSKGEENFHENYNKAPHDEHLNRENRTIPNATVEEMAEGRTEQSPFDFYKKETHPEVEDSLPTDSGHQEEIYIRNAGLVLLHPFLQMLLEELKLAENNRITRAESAVQVLHFLTTGRTGVEWELPLNKLLCGLSPETVIPTKIRLKAKQREECLRLLKAAIRHWSALGNTSPEGLRGTFLYRDGKLSQKEDGSWLLQVEQKGFDVLLADLPWSISIVKLPWMPAPLRVVWL